MPEILLLHHAQGLTPGVKAFADELRAAGHTVHTPDVYEGKTFATLDEGVAHAQHVGFGVLQERGVDAANDLPTDLVYIGMSLGAMPAMKLAMTRPGAKAAVFLHSAIPVEEFGEKWPDGVPLQIHTMENDDWGDVDVAQELVKEIPSAELFLYPGDRHLFTDNSLDAYDDEAATLVKQRVIGFLASVG